MLRLELLDLLTISYLPSYYIDAHSCWDIKFSIALRAPNLLALFILEFDVFALKEVEFPFVVFRQNIVDRMLLTVLEEVIRNNEGVPAITLQKQVRYPYSKGPRSYSYQGIFCDLLYSFCAHIKPNLRLVAGVFWGVFSRARSVVRMRRDDWIMLWLLV